MRVSGLDVELGRVWMEGNVPVDIHTAGEGESGHSQGCREVAATAKAGIRTVVVDCVVVSSAPITTRLTDSRRTIVLRRVALRRRIALLGRRRAVILALMILLSRVVRHGAEMEVVKEVAVRRGAV